VSQVRGQQHLAASLGERGFSQIPHGVDARELRGLQQRVEHGGYLGTATRLRTVVILTADDKSRFILPVSRFA